MMVFKGIGVRVRVRVIPETEERRAKSEERNLYSFIHSSIQAFKQSHIHALFEKEGEEEKRDFTLRALESQWQEKVIRIEGDKVGHRLSRIILRLPQINGRKGVDRIIKNRIN